MSRLTSISTQIYQDIGIEPLGFLPELCAVKYKLFTQNVKEMKKLVLSLVVASSIGCAVAQNYALITNPEIVLADLNPQPVVRQSRPPMFPGGTKALQSFIDQTAHYPDRAFREGIEGTLYVEVSVLADGHLQILGIKGYLGGGCEQEAARTVSLMPRWNPALRASEPVSSKVRIPVTFKWQ